MSDSVDHAIDDAFGSMMRRLDSVQALFKPNGGLSCLVLLEQSRTEIATAVAMLEVGRTQQGIDMLRATISRMVLAGNQ
jgi:hypothetical protein